MQDQRSNPGHTMTLHTYNTQPMSLPNINFQPPYGFRNIAQTRHYRSRSLWQGQRSNQGHTLANVPTKYQLPTPYGFQDVPRQDFIGQGHYSKVKGQIKVRP